MDTIYIGDISTDYCYFCYNEFGQLELYKNQYNSNDDDYYIICSNSPFIYTHNVLVEEERTCQPINVSNSIYYRVDFPFILFMTCVFCLFAGWCTNLITSLIRKGGVLGGLF